MTEVNGHRTIFTPISDALHDLRDAETELHQEQDAAWQRYVARVDRILDADLRAEGSPEVDPVAHALFAGVRSRLDDLRVQAKLGAMEGEDLLTRVRCALDQMAGRLRR
ncbi:MAG: hypothetical protein ABL966_15475 [Acidimicrobiales bacterium]